MSSDKPNHAHVSAYISVEDLANQLVESFDHDELIGLIREIDSTVSDWDFTRALVKLGEDYSDELAELERDRND